MFKKRFLTLASFFVLVTVLFALPGTASARADSTVANPGFEEDNDVTTSPTGWTVTGTYEVNL